MGSKNEETLKIKFKKKEYEINKEALNYILEKVTGVKEIQKRRICKTLKKFGLLNDIFLGEIRKIK